MSILRVIRRKIFCLMCGKTETEILPAPGHDYVDRVCTKCGDVLGGVNGGK